MTLSLPVLRHGAPYASLDEREVVDPRTGEALARVGQANASLVSRDLRRWPTAPALSDAERAGCMRQVAEHLQDTGSAAYIQNTALIAATTGLTLDQVSAQVARLAAGLLELAAMTPAASGERPVIAFVLPSNAPGVHMAWLSALALGHPVALKPGRLEPWTPFWLADALLEAGLPREYIGLYPGDHAAANAALEAAPLGVVFGDESTVERYRDAPSIDVRGPGRSKAYLAPGSWEREGVLADLVEGVLAFGGRSCLNTSTIAVVDGTTQDVAGLTATLNRAFDEVPDDALAGWPETASADSIAAWLQATTDGHAQARAVHREDGMASLRPMAVASPEPGAPWVATEAPFAFVVVTAVRRADLETWTGPTLAASVVGEGGLADGLAGLGSILRVVPGERPTTEATDVRFHVEALRRLAP